MKERSPGSENRRPLASVLVAIGALGLLRPASVLRLGIPIVLVPKSKKALLLLNSHNRKSIIFSCFCSSVRK